MKFKIAKTRLAGKTAKNGNKKHRANIKNRQANSCSSVVADAPIAQAPVPVLHTAEDFWQAAVKLRQTHPLRALEYVGNILESAVPDVTAQHQRDAFALQEVILRAFLDRSLASMPKAWNATHGAWMVRLSQGNRLAPLKNQFTDNTAGQAQIEQLRAWRDQAIVALNTPEHDRAVRAFQRVLARHVLAANIRIVRHYLQLEQLHHALFEAHVVVHGAHGLDTDYVAQNLQVQLAMLKAEVYVILENADAAKRAMAEAQPCVDALSALSFESARHAQVLVAHMQMRIALLANESATTKTVSLRLLEHIVQALEKDSLGTGTQAHLLQLREETRKVHRKLHAPYFGAIDLWQRKMSA